MRDLDRIDRSDYQERRQRFLRTHVDLSSTVGLEFGGFDLPTVPPRLGQCAIADMRTEYHLAREFGIPVALIPPVDCVVEPSVAAHRQISLRFDYVILCHVLEHIPDVITTINDLAQLLDPGGLLFIALPDKRETPDASRASTTLARLVERQVEQVKTPSMSEIAEFSLAWNQTYRDQFDESMQEFFHEVRSQQLFGDPDVHCNVWSDDEFLEQVRQLIRGGFLEGLEIVEAEPTKAPFNEFYVLLRRLPDSNESPDGAAGSRMPSVYYRSCNFCGYGRFRVWKRLHAPFPEKLYRDSDPDVDIGRHLSLQYLTCRRCDLSSINPLPAFDVVDRPQFSVQDVLDTDSQGVGSLIADCERVIETLSAQYEFEGFRENGRLLDVSCGPGIALAWLRDRRGWEVRGTEPAREFVRFAKDRFDLEIHNGLVQDLPEPDGSFDMVMIDSSLQYMFDPLGTLLACHRLLREGGGLFLHLPNRDGLATEYIDLNVHWGHWFSFSAPVLVRMLTEIGFQSERILSIQGVLDPRVRERLSAGFDARREGLEVDLRGHDEIDGYLDGGGKLRADFFGICARKLPVSEASSTSIAALSEVAACSRRQRYCVAIDPESSVWWPWEQDPSGSDEPPTEL